MNILGIIYTIVIGPLKLLLEFIFMASWYITHNAGLSIIAMSLVMNILLLPLYNMTDRIQEEQSKKDKELKPGIDHIKKSFKGDEQYMILQTYYRQNNYNPLSILKGSLSLLLEIPFFIAAYDFLSGLSVLSKCSFFVINDLAKPDGLLSMGNNSINLLPIVMTTINIISCVIYTNGQSIKSRIQLYATALVFLVLLYNAPSGLAFYYTLNNIFSLLKNIINKTKKPKLSICILSSIVGLFGLPIILFIYPLPTFQKPAIIVLCLMQLPIIFYRLTLNANLSFNITITNNRKIFYSSLIFICIFIGLYIPSNVINASVSEFINFHDFINPNTYIFNTLFLSIGTFLIWINVYYLLSNEKIKSLFEITSLFVLFMFVINYMAFGTKLGFLSTALKYDGGIKYSLLEMIVNIIVLILLGILVTKFVFKNKKIHYLISIFIITIAIISTINIINIDSIYEETRNNYIDSNHEQAKLSLSKNEKNVVVIILDRSINTYFPYLLEEHPELQNQFKGFTYYPNTISFGKTTKLGLNGIYGGYEYTPDEINRRSNELLSDKHDEACKVMPKLFTDNNYDVTLFDTPDVGYGKISQEKLFSEFDNVDTYITNNGMFRLDNFDYVSSFLDLNRNLFCYGIVKTAPLCIQNGLYARAKYFNSKYADERNIVVSDAFIDTYAVLANLSKITDSDNEKGRLSIIYNITTHEATTLQEPNYEPSYYVDNEDYDNQHKYRKSITGDTIELVTEPQYQHYHINMASYIQIGNWLDILREEGIYDNTKIIITADHGSSLNQFESMMINEEDDVMSYNPILLVKDYDCQEFTIDNSFMTDADVVTLACKDIIDNPINPYTGKIINNEMKNDGCLVSFSKESLLSDNEGGKTFLDSDWYFVKDNIFDIKNWTKIEK